jgi:Abnormal spindle-like microcephaly-assoc'd, ASPM-SPD-2-Hydin
VLLSGGGAIPLPSMSTDLLEFAMDSGHRQPSAQVIRLSNIGLGLLKIVQVEITGQSSESFSVADNTCAGVSLHTGESCTLHVDFAPHDNGTYHATLTIRDNASGSPRLVALKGTVKG